MIFVVAGLTFMSLFHFELVLVWGTSAGEDVEKGEPYALLVGMQTGAATVESIMEIHLKIKNGSAF